ncbi:hypothetical protein RB195_024433 [Necator americanus]|uniref:Uncharacterized protein n=1 Tax=Necator americanus TaxID=51031 RepID=A0ABR1EN55_NECAM
MSTSVLFAGFDFNKATHLRLCRHPQERGVLEFTIQRTAVQCCETDGVDFGMVWTTAPFCNVWEAFVTVPVIEAPPLCTPCIQVRAIEDQLTQVRQMKSLLSGLDASSSHISREDFSCFWNITSRHGLVNGGTCEDDRASLMSLIQDRDNIVAVKLIETDDLSGDGFLLGGSSDMADVVPPAAWSSYNGSQESPAALGESVPREVAQLAEKYQFSIKDERSIQKELKKIIRSAVKKQMRIKAGYVQMQKATNGKKQSDYLKKEVRDLSDQISNMQDDLQILDVYDTGAFDESNCVSSPYWFLKKLVE